MAQFETPILFIIFNRHDTARQVFDVIRKIKPKKLFVFADGPRQTRPGEEILCEKTRKVVSGVDWPCEVRTNFMDQNLGCHFAVPKAISWFFGEVEEGIVLEDDCLPNDTFFSFCQSLLQKYRDNDEIMIISGDNFGQSASKSGYSYYFSKHTNIWGWASWRRAWMKYQHDFSKLDDDKMKKNVESSFLTKAEKKYWFGFYKKIKKGRLWGWDAKWFLSIIYAGGKNIVPTVNLIKNIGFGPDATNTVGGDHLSLQTHSIVNIVHPEVDSIDFQADNYLFETMYKVSPLKRLYFGIISHLRKR